MDDWRDPWADEETGAASTGQVTTRGILAGWEDEAGWGEFVRNEEDTRKDAEGQTPGNEELRIETLRPKRAPNESIDSAISFGLLPEDDFDGDLEQELSKEHQLEPRHPAVAAAEHSEAKIEKLSCPETCTEEHENAQERSLHGPGGRANIDKAFHGHTAVPQADSIRSQDQSDSFQHGGTRGLAGPDGTLIGKLFDRPLPKRGSFDECEDIILSATVRKAWYRLTRKETLREFNKGDPDNSYVRVRWRQSEVRKRTLAIVSRWAQDDRLDRRDLEQGVQNAELSKKTVLADGATFLPTMSDRSSLIMTSSKSYSNDVRRSIQSPPAAAQFNWSTGGNLPNPIQNVEENIIDISLRAPAKDNLVMDLAQNAKTATKGLPIVLPIINDEDEEWGEMVESPTATALERNSRELAHDTVSSEPTSSSPSSNKNQLEAFLLSLPDLTYMIK